MKSLKMVVLAMLVAVLIVPVVAAQPGTWTSSFSVINLSDEVATVTVTFYNSTGGDYTPACLGWSGDPPTCDLDNPFTLAGGAKAEVNLSAIDDADLPADRYSVVISSDKPVAAIGSLLGDDGGLYYSASYTGMEDEGQMSMYLPGVQWSFYAWYSHFSIQNLTGSAQTVDVYIYEEGSATVCWSEMDHSIPAYSSWHLDLEAEDLTACDVISDYDSDGVAYNGAARIDGDGPIAVVDNQTTLPTECAGCHLEVAYNGFQNGLDTLYLPDLYRGFAPIGHTGWNSSINIQNVGGAETVVTVAFQGTTVEVTRTLAANAGVLLYLPSDVPGLPEAMWQTYSAMVTTDGEPVVAIANAATPGEVSQAMTHSGLLGGGATVAVPTLWHDYYGWNTSFVIQNLGGDGLIPHVCYAANANPYGTPWGGACFDLPTAYEIPGGGSLMFYQGDGDLYLCEGTGGTWDAGTKTCTGGETIPTTYLGGATVTITSGTGPIAGVANATQDAQQALRTGDWSMSFNTIQ